MRTIVKFLLIQILFLPSLFSQIAPSFARPSESWVRNGVIYEIYPRSFSSEGTFEGISKRLPELRSLGVTILWIMPIHPVGVLKRKGTLGSPYSIKDYYAVNPEFGTIDDFKNLVKKSHDFGLRIIIDLVANHTSWDNPLISSHPDWYTHDSSGSIISPNPDWSDVADLDYSNLELRRWMIDMMKYWVQDIGIDGFRCDVSEMVPTDFLEEARRTLDAVKPVCMLSEGSLPEHHIKAFDLTYSWNLYHALSPLLQARQPASYLDSILAVEKNAFPRGSLRMRFSSNHDETAWDKPDVEKFGIDGARLAAALVNTLPGVPLLYNGQEVGNPSVLPLFERKQIDWSRGNDFRKFYSQLYSFRRSHPALVEGSMTRLKSSNDASLYSFIRSFGSDTVLVAVNFDSAAFSGTINLSPLFSPSRKTIRCFEILNGGNDISVAQQSSMLPIKISPHGFRFFVLY